MEGVPLLDGEEHAEKNEKRREIIGIHSEENKMADPLSLMVNGASCLSFLIVAKTFLHLFMANVQ